MVLDDEDGQDDDFETGEEELDPDCPCPSIIQDLDMDMGGDVLHVAVPNLYASASTPRLLQTTALVTIALYNGAVRLLEIPLTPPSDTVKDATVKSISRTSKELSIKGPLPSDLAMKLFPVDHLPDAGLQRQHEHEGIVSHLLVASASRALNTWTFSVAADALAGEEEGLFQRNQSIPLTSPASHLTFHPSSRYAQLLVTDISGAARIYDPYAPKTSPKRPGSSDSQLAQIKSTTTTGSAGRWIMTYHTGFQSAKEGSGPSALARRKKILGAKWVNSGKGILALLEDGQWGIWDLTGSARPDKGVEEFVLDGYLSPSTSSDAVEAAKSKKGLSKLAPMTPNTRKAKSEQLFTGAAKVSGVAARGGISVSSNNSRTSQTDESVVMWYNGDVYSITSMHQFWQRSTTNNGSFGSLYAPGLAHLTDIDLISENITSVSQFRSQSSSAGIGHMNTQRDLLITGEHRAIILQNIRPSTPSRGLFAAQLAERPASSRDTQMFDAAQDQGLDVINAVLDSMSAAPRKVGFAH